MKKIGISSLNRYHWTVSINIKRIVSNLVNICSKTISSSDFQNNSTFHLFVAISLIGRVKQNNKKELKKLLMDIANKNENSNHLITI